MVFWYSFTAANWTNSIFSFSVTREYFSSPLLGSKIQSTIVISSQDPSFQIIFGFFYCLVYLYLCVSKSESGRLPSCYFCSKYWGFFLLEFTAEQDDLGYLSYLKPKHWNDVFSKCRSGVLNLTLVSDFGSLHSWNEAREFRSTTFALFFSLAHFHVPSSLFLNFFVMFFNALTSCHS